jgi:hypothetical protein
MGYRDVLGLAHKAGSWGLDVLSQRDARICSLQRELQALAFDNSITVGGAVKAAAYDVILHPLSEQRDRDMTRAPVNFIKTHWGHSHVLVLGAAQDSEFSFVLLTRCYQSHHSRGPWLGPDAD